MSGSVNKVILVGNLGKAPEVRMAGEGNKIVSFPLATNESWKDKTTGERKDRTEWHRVVIYNEKLADIAEKYLTKGSKVYIEGQLQTRKWTDQQGVERYTTEIALQRYRGEMTLLDARGTVEGSYGEALGGFDTSPLGSSSSGSSSTTGSPQPFPELNDDVPF